MSHEGMIVVEAIDSINFVKNILQVYTKLQVQVLQTTELFVSVNVSWRYVYVVYNWVWGYRYNKLCNLWKSKRLFNHEDKRKPVPILQITEVLVHS